VPPSDSIPWFKCPYLGRLQSFAPAMAVRCPHVNEPTTSRLLKPRQEAEIDEAVDVGHGIGSRGHHRVVLSGGGHVPPPDRKTPAAAVEARLGPHASVP
jgi:hypothetical protein